MNLLRKVLSLTLMLALVLGLSAPALAAGTGGQSGAIGGVYQTQYGESGSGSTGLKIYNENDPSTYSDKVQWTLDNGVVTISGQGSTADFGMSPFSGNSGVEAVVVEAGVTNLGLCLFQNMPNLRAVILMDASTTFDAAFAGDFPSLEAVLVGANLKGGAFTTPNLVRAEAVEAKILPLTREVLLKNGLENGILADDSDIYLVYGDENILVVENGKRISSSDSGVERQYRSRVVNTDTRFFPYDSILSMARGVIQDLPAAAKGGLPAGLTSGAAMAVPGPGDPGQSPAPGETGSTTQPGGTEPSETPDPGASETPGPGTSETPEPGAGGDHIDAYGRNFQRVVGGTYYAEQLSDGVFQGRIATYQCPKGGLHQVSYHMPQPTCAGPYYDYNYCTVCGEREIFHEFPPVDHTYVGRVTTPATAQSAGVRTYTCSVCGVSYTESIPRLTGTAESPVTADPNAVAAETNNMGDNEYDTYATVLSSSYLYLRSDGYYTRVEELTRDAVAVEVYDQEFQLLTADTVPMELSRFGGFFAGENYNFLIFGQSNHEEDDSKEVIRVVKYSKDWERLGQASLQGADTYAPFVAGTVRCAEYNGMLYVMTSHTMYADSSGVHHQADLIFSVRQSDMAITDTRLNGTGRASHSFNQFILVDEDGWLITLAHGDANPRSALLVRYDNAAGQDKFQGSVERMGLMGFVESRKHYNYTGAALGGLAESGSHYLVSLSTIPQTGMVEDHTVRNVVIKAVDKENFNLKGFLETFQITQYPEGGDFSAGNPSLVKISDDRFLVMWNILAKDVYGEYQPGRQVGYVFLDGTGRPVGDVQTASATLSDCQPIYDGERVVWYCTYLSTPTFCTIDAGTGAFRRLSPLDPEAAFSGWAEEELQEAANQGLIPKTGLKDDYTQPITRREFAILAVHAYETITGKTVPIDFEAKDTVFADSIGDLPVAKAYNLGILTGYNGGDSRAEIRVGPGDLITREQAATLLARLGEVLGSPMSPAQRLPYTDAIASWAYDGVSKVYQAGIMTGASATAFNASGTYTTEQSIVTMVRLCDWLRGEQG